jgi:hypothetical protein
MNKNIQISGVISLNYHSKDVDEVLDLVETYKKDGWKLIDFQLAYENKEGFYKLKKLN